MSGSVGEVLESYPEEPGLAFIQSQMRRNVAAEAKASANIITNGGGVNMQRACK